ncbi:MAG TPA: YceI family protein [Edaphobacter sp.]|nr:YceI family protein [Edaphobacter sp.]
MSIFSLAGLLFAGLSAKAQTSTWKIDPAHSSVQFTVRHMGVSNVHGSIGNVVGTVVLNDADITKSSVKATMDASTVWTGTAARDNDLKSPNFFDVAKYPQLSFSSTSLARINGKLQLTGDLTIAGVTRKVTFDLDGPSTPITGKDGKTRSGFSASGTLKRSDFNFAPKYPAAIIGNDIKFTIDVELDKQ